MGKAPGHQEGDQGGTNHLGPGEFDQIHTLVLFLSPAQGDREESVVEQVADSALQGKEKESPAEKQATKVN